MECPERLVEGDQKPEQRVLYFSRALVTKRNGNKTEPNYHRRLTISISINARLHAKARKDGSQSQSLARLISSKHNARWKAA